MAHRNFIVNTLVRKQAFYSRTAPSSKRNKKRDNQLKQNYTFSDVHFHRETQSHLQTHRI